MTLRAYEKIKYLVQVFLNRKQKPYVPHHCLLSDVAFYGNGTDINYKESTKQL